MALINQRLLDRLAKKLDVTPSRVYALIEEKVRTTRLPRNLAAIELAMDKGINIAKFASEEDLQIIRSGGKSIAPPLPTTLVDPGRSRIVAKEKKSKPRRGNTVFVVHGRDMTAKSSIFSFLRSLSLKPLEWNSLIKATRKGSPYVGEILDVAFEKAVAIVVLLTPDDEVRLRKDLITSSDPESEKKLVGQARPNVLFEAGMAFGRYPKATILVQIGDVRPFSDVGGRHVVRMSDSAESRRELATKLENAGCAVDLSGTDWLTSGVFASTAARRKKLTP